MRRGLGRRAFIGGSAAVCLGCSGDDAAGGASSSSSSTSTSSRSSSTVDGLGVGAGIEIAPLAEIEAELDSIGARYVPEARSYVVRLPVEALERALAAYDERLHDGLRDGFVGVYQRCPHLGCRVRFCESSGWFECPCHAGRFNGVGEYQAGVPERGLDLLPVRLVDGIVVLDRGPVVTGRPVDGGVVTTAPAGPHCVEIRRST